MSAEPRHAELEQRIAEDPYDATGYQIYADWLLQQGDPRGELISLHVQLERLAGTPDEYGANADELRRLASAHFERHADALLGPLREYAGAMLGGPVPFGWRFGFIQEVLLDPDEGVVPEMLEAVLLHPSGRFVTDLEMAVADHEQAQAAIAVLTRHAPPTMRSLIIECPLHLGDLSRLWPKLPRLQRLRLTARSFMLGELELPTLTSAKVQAGQLSAGAMKSIATARWPAIETLQIRIGSGSAGIQQLWPMFERTDLPALRRLAVRSCSFTAAICERLPGSPLGRQLEILDLAFGTTYEDNLRALRQLPALKTIIVTSEFDLQLQTLMKPVELRYCSETSLAYLEPGGAE